MKIFNLFRFKKMSDIDLTPPEPIVSAVPNPRLEIIEKVLRDMNYDVRSIVNILSKNCTANPAFEAGCTFKCGDVQLMLTSHYIYIDSLGERIYSKGYEEDISLFSTYLTTKTLLELWNEDVKEQETNKEEVIKQTLINLKRKK